jgi:tetratricopeptide (TPR) repeat protein
LKPDQMFRQEFARLLAALNNNVSACYCKLDDYERADYFNNIALMEDPEYAKAFHRKCILLEEQGRFTEAFNMANWGIIRFDNDYEEEENRKIVPRFKEMQSRCESQMPHEEKIRTEKVEEKIKKEIEEEETETEKTTRQSIAGMMQQLEEMLKSGA